MRFAILSQYYPPEIGAPQARLSDLARRMSARGHDVTVITGMPNYPTGRIYQGYGGLVRREVIDGVRVVRTFLYPTQSLSVVRRVMSYLSFAASASVLAPVFLRKTDYLMVESPPLLLGPAGWWLSLWSRARLIFNVSDLWPDSAVWLGVLRRESRAFRLAAAVERFCYRRAWLITGQSRSIVSNIRGRFPALRTFHLSNGVDTKRFGPSDASPSARETLAAGAECVVLYAGLHGLAQGLDQLLAAADRLKHDEGLRVVLIGDGPEKAALVDDARRRGLTNVTFLNSVPHAGMPALLASADIVVITLKKEIPGAVPSKLYEAMAAGRPVIIVATGEAAETVREHRAGLAVAPGDIDGLVQAITELRSSVEHAAELGLNGRDAVERHFNRDTIGGAFIDYLENALPANAT